MSTLMQWGGRRKDQSIKLAYAASFNITVVKLLADEFNCPFLRFDDHTDKNT
ncbi:MAG: hypothetical protein P8I03_10590 [Thalassotalea sp.]|nr:hypothetical protein [Thalassotalea sp.]